MRAIIIVFLGAVSYGILSTIVKIAYGEGFTVQEVSGAQFGIGACIMWSIAFIYLKKQLKKVTNRQKISLLLVGITSGLTGLFYYTALQSIPASLAIILLFQFTWIGVLFDAIFNKKRLTKVTIASLLFLLIGTILASGVTSNLSKNIDNYGIFLGLLSAFTYSMFVFFSGKVSEEVPAVLKSTWIVTGGMITVFILYPPNFLYNGSLLNGLWFYGLLLALFGPILPTLAFTYGVPKIGPGLATILGAAELPTVIIASTVILKEDVSVIQWIGILIILVAIALPQIHLIRHPK